MNKSELAAQVAEILELSQAKGSQAVDAVFLAIQKALSEGDSVSLVGFGTFSVKKRAARMGRNPQTGEEIAIAARKVAHFKAGKKLKEAVND